MKGAGTHFRSRNLRGSILLSLAVLMICNFSLRAQVSVDAGSDGTVGKGNFEDIYIQTDRDIYIAGESVYFRTMQSGRLSGIPGTISKVLYVDLLDSYRTPVVQVRTGTDGIAGAGEFRIPDTLRTGSYFIRSFTNLMKNYPQALFAYKKISVINPFESLSRLRIPPSDHQADSVRFYPETGFLTAGVQTRVGIRCYNNSGDPVITNGIVLDGRGDTLARFTTDRHGTGLFTLTPEDAGPLFLFASGSKSTGRRFPLPPVRENGLTFTVGAGSTDGDIRIITKTGGDGYKAPGGTVRAVYAPVSGGSIVKEVFFENDPVIALDRGDLPAGLARIILTDSDGGVLASRWYYNNRRPEITYEVKVGSGSFSPRGKAEIVIKAVDSEGNGIETTLSVSVVKPVLTAGNHYTDMVRQVQLPSLQAFNTDMILPDINDYLIFCDENGDLLKEGGKAPEIVYLPEPEGHLIGGYVRDRNTGAPLAGENLSLSFVGRTARCGFTRTGPNGEFSFPVREYGKREIVIQRLSPEENGYYVDLNDPFLFEMRLDREPGPFYPDTARLEELNNAIIAMQVRNIYDPFLQKKAVMLSSEVFPDFFGEPDRTILLSDYIELTTLREVFKEIVPGLSSAGRNERSSLRLVNRHPGVSFSTPPLVIIDGVPVYDLEKVLEIRSPEIERIEVLNTRYFIGDVVLDGIINVVSGKGDLSLLEFDRSIFRQEYDMLLDSYEVIAPDYSDDGHRESRIPDLRNTLYWNPSVRTDSRGNAGLEFWTSDEAGEYEVIVEGFTPDGRSGRTVTSLTVRK
jgi:hypothetical protein